MKDYLYIFGFGIFCGVALIAFLVAITPNPLTDGKQALKECELELPRNESCFITAIKKPSLQLSRKGLISSCSVTGTDKQDDRKTISPIE